MINAGSSASVSTALKTLLCRARASSQLVSAGNRGPVTSTKLRSGSAGLSVRIFSAPAASVMTARTPLSRRRYSSASTPNSVERGTAIAAIL